MKFLKSLALSACVLMMSSCSTSPFSCNQTAADSCLSVEEANAMADKGLYLTSGNRYGSTTQAGRGGKQSLAQR
jgi:starvation-inducible outer membrane lipoprotein